MFKGMCVGRRHILKSTRFSLGQNENLTYLSMMCLIFQWQCKSKAFFFLKKKLDLSTLLIVKSFRVPCASRGRLRRLLALYPFFKPCGSSSVVCSRDKKRDLEIGRYGPVLRRVSGLWISSSLCMTYSTVSHKICGCRPHAEGPGDTSWRNQHKMDHLKR